uniref:Uncharacterized protein n=2 Tax=Palpitomonas bilix TaxID=652834 RepID=A0A7S3D4Q6_9EUKA|mmetsp:Transcript_21321/g.55412  ORF Transcript_21321/g.55412 Transcript_21321/m.55412 type:complete len:146 (+) Transcript_21321:515-952(+)
MCEERTPSVESVPIQIEGGAADTEKVNEVVASPNSAAEDIGPLYLQEVLSTISERSSIVSTDSAVKEDGSEKSETVDDETFSPYQEYRDHAIPWFAKFMTGMLGEGAIKGGKAKQDCVWPDSYAQTLVDFELSLSRDEKSDDPDA